MGFRGRKKKALALAEPQPKAADEDVKSVRPSIETVIHISAEEFVGQLGTEFRPLHEGSRDLRRWPGPSRWRGAYGRAELALATPHPVDADENATTIRPPVETVIHISAEDSGDYTANGDGISAET